MDESRPELPTRDDVLRAAVEILRDAPGLLLVGPTGIGKSSLLARLEQNAADQGVRVLRCAPVAAELPLPFMCLIDLLESVPDDTIACLPAMQRDALRAALLRGEGPDASDRGALVHVAVLTLLRLLSEQSPLWLVVDDLQWMDGPTAQILGVVSRRAAGPRLRMVATERQTAGRAAARREACPPGTVEFTVPRMGPGELAEVLELAANGPLPASTARWISEVAQGNPLYALEIVRSLPESGSLRTAPLNGADPALTVPGPLRALLLDRVRTLPEAVRATLELVSAAARPDLALLATVGGGAAAGHVEAAERAGVVRIGSDGQIRFDHPLLRAAVYSEATGQARRAAHARLAAAATEPVERARHLALANPARDEDVALTLTVAADAAKRRGAPATAAELAALAVARTPAEAGAERGVRRLTQAEYAWDAGYHEQARAAARTVLAEEDGQEIRARARIVLLKCAGQALEGEDRLIEEGLAEADGEPALESQLHTWASTRHLLAGRLGQAGAEARRAADLADLADDPVAAVEALTELAYMQRLDGDRDAEATLSRALSLARDRGIDDVRLWETLLTQALFHLHANRLVEAEHAVTAAQARFGDQINVEDSLRVQVALTDVRSRSGDCAGALQAARRAADLYEDVDDSQGPVAYALAAAESFGGSLQSAREYAERGAASARCDGDRFWYMWNLTVLGRVHLFSDEPVDAARVLREVYVIEREMGIVDPGVGRWHPDLAEALVAEGSLDEAAGFLDEVRALARRLDRTAVLACLDRPAALLSLAEGKIGSAAALLESSVDRLRGEGLPLELARSLAALARVERRRRRPAQARLAAAEASGLCRTAGAVALLGAVERAAPPAGRKPGAPKPVMTLTESRVAELAVSGSTNREIAAACYLSVKTVEAALSRVYRKLGVRSRTELAKTLSN